MIDSETAVAEQIVDAARSYFLRFGYSRVSTEEIARSIGRSKKTLYKHFETKEALLHAVLARVDSEAQRTITALLAERGGDRLARLKRILVAVAVHIASTHQVLLADLRATAPDLAQQAWRERRRALCELLLPVMHEAAQHGAMRGDLDCEQVLHIFFTCVEGMASPLDVAHHAQAPGDLFATLVELLVEGLRRR
ncbi:MAG: TetR/AcrR family transcriptional regulator [Planctomycetota bacterium]|nr:TetR/AcrR family transcriptional regulator [Planctomycetota bacterium]MCX8040654.1 TetR/AcrR family transcriptional regulator [Planctomycetota bacterium]MDW8372797.1 TetR/AcrR family transcriptional regulator [Planctomycetota bacterium]